MSIVRYENITINQVSNGVNSFGEYTTTLTKWFDTRALVENVSNALRISDRYREYNDVIMFTVNYTRNTKTMAESSFNYSITWGNKEWRITDAKEHNNRQKVTFYCYFNHPSTPV